VGSGVREEDAMVARKLEAVPETEDSAIREELDGLRRDIDALGRAFGEVVQRLKLTSQLQQLKAAENAVQAQLDAMGP
jgi:hypothetical protein